MTDPAQLEDQETETLLSGHHERHRGRAAWEKQRAWMMVSEAHGRKIFCRCVCDTAREWADPDKPRDPWRSPGRGCPWTSLWWASSSSPTA
jgi:hypothetical protein